MNSDIDWIFAFIEIAIGIYSLLKGMIDFMYIVAYQSIQTVIHLY